MKRGKWAGEGEGGNRCQKRLNVKKISKARTAAGRGETTLSTHSHRDRAEARKGKEPKEGGGERLRQGNRAVIEGKESERRGKAQ